MAFVGKPRKAQQQFEDPEELYLRGALPRTAEAVSSLWTHQSDVLRAYAEEHQDTSDLAMELPTGTGKTLPGLLIAEWVRRKTQRPVLYATPTRQLARQVYATAMTEGVSAHQLFGNHHQWEPAHQADVSNGQAIAITTYSSIFNSSPKLPTPHLIMLDDAHAGEQFVGEEYGVSIRRNESEEAYSVVLETLHPFLSGLQIQRLRGRPDPGAHHQVRLILPAVDEGALKHLDFSLANLGDPYKFQLSMIRSGLSSCCVYISYGAIQIRPMIPPTHTNKVFSEAKQRIYLSATLGVGGELERAFGRSSITRMPLKTRTPPRSGRRLFVFADLVRGGDADGLTKELVGVTDKALVLSQTSSGRTEEAARVLAGDEVPVLGKDAVEGGLSAFAEADSGVLALTNRYDGMDLPGDSCRVMVLDGKPDAVGLQEKFLSERARASAALSERIRTRIVQGAGRCTRGPKDYAVVVVRGTGINRYFAESDNQAALDPELQAEVMFGWENSREKSKAEILDNVRTFLDHGSDWHEAGEPLIAEFREDAESREPAGAVALGESAKTEVEAWRLAFEEDWVAASQRLEEAARTVGNGGEETRGYRALLLYIAGVWLHLGADSGTGRARARELVRNAEAASTRGNWLKEMKALPESEVNTLSRSDSIAINEISAKITGNIKVNGVKRDLKKMRDGLAQEESGPYEEALKILGGMLGADAYKPKGQARCDSAWLWDHAMWVAIEAKSGMHPGGLLPVKYIRQANSQLSHLAGDQGVPNAPAGSPTVLVTDRHAVSSQDAPAANSNVYLASSQVVRQIAGDVDAAWEYLLATTAREQSVEAVRRDVQEVLVENGCLPTQVVDRLMESRISPEY